MQKRTGEEDFSVALYWDFENLHAALCEARQEGSYSGKDNRFKPQDPLVDVQSIVELAASFGPIAINRAYCNWQFFGRYRDALLQNAVELVQLFPPGGSAKNGADIKLCLDAIEDVNRFSHIGTVLVVGGDSDFMPVAQKIKAAGRKLVGIGARKSTNRHWARSCHEFRYYESLAEQPAEAVAAAPAGAAAGAVAEAAPRQEVPANPALDIFIRAVRLLEEKDGESWVKKGAIWHMIKRLDSTFDTKEHGFANFRAMVKSFDAAVEVRDGESDQEVRLRGSA